MRAVYLQFNALELMGLPSVCKTATGSVAVFTIYGAETITLIFNAVSLTLGYKRPLDGVSQNDVKYQICLELALCIKGVRVSPVFVPGMLRSKH